MLWTKANGYKVYISIFPSNIIKYNKVDTELIEFISSNVKEGEDIFKYVNDSENNLDCEDVLIHSCEKVEKACLRRHFSSLLSSRFTEILNKTIEVVNFSDFLKLELKFKEIYLLLKTAAECFNYGIIKGYDLSSLNLIFKFLR